MELKTAILDVLAYFATFRLPLSERQILQLMPLKTGNLAVKATLKELVTEEKVRRTADRIYLKKQNYPNYEQQQFKQAALLKKARRWSLLFRLIPFVKAIVVVNSVSYGNVHADSDIDLLILTRPNRIYLSKAILMYGLKASGQLETEQQKAGKFSLGMFLTTISADFRTDIMKTNRPHLYYWLIMAKPVYGAKLWYLLLKKDPKLLQQFPNYEWPKAGLAIYANGFRLFNWLDEIAYHRHLQHTASQGKNKTAKAFIRLRPDIINLHAIDRSTAIADKYAKIRAQY